MSPVCDNPARRAGEQRDDGSVQLTGHAPEAGTLQIWLWVLSSVVVILVLIAILLPAMHSGPMPVDARDKAEAVQLTQGIEGFRAKFGSYPPDFTDSARVQQFFRKCFPRSLDVPPTNLDHAQALVFWLNGFGPDPQHPLSGAADERQSFYQFDLSRLTAGSYSAYCPRDSSAPYVYFEATSYDHPDCYYSNRGTGTARPYRSDVTAGWCQPVSFQIISAGRDGDYGSHMSRGTEGHWPGGKNFTLGDRDNVVSFTDRLTLGDDLP